MEPVGVNKVISDLKACLQLMHSEKPVLFISEDFCEKRGQKTKHPKSDRFLINLFERPPNTRNKQREGQRDVCQTIDWNPTRPSPMDLRSKRDIECLKIKQASNIIHFLNKNVPYGGWQERLLAEKVLLASGETLHILKNKIKSDTGVTKPETNVASVSVSNFKFNQLETRTKPDETEFFILLLSNETDVRVSEVTRCVNGLIHFDENFTFFVNSNFKIRVQLHSLVLKEAPKFLPLPKFRKNNYQRNSTLKLKFKNLNTCDFEETEVLKTGFQLCAETEICPRTFHNKTRRLISSRPFLYEVVTFSTAVDSFKIGYQKCGFLGSGVMVGTTVVWNRRWCVLDGHLLKIYSSPCDESEEPLMVLNLERCSFSKIDEASRDVCNRPRSFIVRIDQTHYYFMADDLRELRSWLDSLNLVLELVVRFKFCLNF